MLIVNDGLINLAIPAVYSSDLDPDGMNFNPSYSE